MAQAMTVLTREWADLNGTSCDMPWRSVGGRELVCTVNPGHPISAGLPQSSRSTPARRTASTLTSRSTASSSSPQAFLRARSSAADAAPKGLPAAFSTPAQATRNTPSITTRSCGGWRRMVSAGPSESRAFSPSPAGSRRWNPTGSTASPPIRLCLVTRQRQPPRAVKLGGRGLPDDA
jgi:hypothetical protein